MLALMYIRVNHHHLYMISFLLYTATFVKVSCAPQMIINIIYILRVILKAIISEKSKIK
ncbi:hypothetical protein AI2913V1_1570 [Klebsiella aerogenes]|nr:hypothetical protein F8B42_03944 [Klebsiella aerogenes]CAF9405842.1 hypothetical protein AI2913V1_1570 [Klebsiella aerogenes]CAH5864239.1 hypothetical protein AI2913V1_1570 [Klebsiella aerogenes]